MIKSTVATLTAGLIGILLVALPLHCALADRRVALVFGNSAYQNSALQANTPKNDAEDITKTLKILGFEVLLATNTDLASAGKAIQQFARSAQGADAALFFYAGHALQYRGENFLLPTDADIRDEISLPFESISLASIRAALDRSKGIKIMMLDAARRNIIAERLAALTLGRSNSATPQVTEQTRGVDYADKNDNLIVVFSSEPDAVSSDSPGRNSPFTTALLQRLNEPGLEIETLFAKVKGDVEAATSRRQKPVIYSSLDQDYYLNQEDHFAWDKIKTTQDPAVLQDFLEHFPSSYFIFEARHRLKALQSALEAAAERTRAEAREKLQREALEKREAELACQSARKKLGELDPHDQAGFRTFSETAPCGEAKAEAQIKLAASLALIAKEAEACRKDTALLENLGGDNLSKIASLAKNSLCEAVKKAATEKKSLIEAQNKEDDAKRLREAEICKKEELDFKPLVGASANEESIRKLDDLQKQHQCPGLTTPIEMALANLRRAAESACQQDQKAFNALSPHDNEGLKAFAARNDLCGTVRESAIERLKVLQVRLTREAETCRKEESLARQLTEKGDTQGLEALRANVECPLVTAFIDQSLQSIKTVQTQTCTKESAELAALAAEAPGASGLDPEFLKSKLEQIGVFSAKTACGDVKTEAQTLLAALQVKLVKREAELASEEAVCREEKIKWAMLATNENRETLKKFRAEGQCLSLKPEIDQKIAELNTICEKEARTLISLGEADHEGLKSLASTAVCENTKTLASAKLAALETKLAEEADVCRKDQEEWQSLSARGSKAALEAFRAKAQCANLIPAIDQKIAALGSACEKEARRLISLGETDHEGLKSLASSATCENVKTLAAGKLAALETKLAKEAEACRKDQDQWQALSTQGNKGALEAFRAKVQCANLIPAIDQKIAALASACEKEARTLISLGETDREGLKSLASSATCENTKNLASGKLAALESKRVEQANVGALEQDNKTCQSEEEKFNVLAESHDKTKIEALRKYAHCAATIAKIDGKLIRIDTECRVEERLSAGLEKNDISGMKDYLAHAICEKTKNAVKLRLEAALAAQDSSIPGKYGLPTPEADHHQEKHPKKEGEPREQVKGKTAAKASPSPHITEPSQSAAGDPARATAPRPDRSSTLRNLQ